MLTNVLKCVIVCVFKEWFTKIYISWCFDVVIYLFLYCFFEGRGTLQKTI